MTAPGNWTPRLIGELFDITAGKALSATRRHGPTQVPFLRTANVLWDRIDLSEVDQMAYSDQELTTRVLEEGDLLVCEGGEIGRSAIWRGELTRCGFQNHVHRLRAKVPEVDPEFVMFYLWAGFTRLGLFEGVGNSTTIPNLSRNKLAQLEIRLPPFAEQQTIAAVLRLVREQLDQSHRELALAVELKRSMTAHLFASGTRGEEPKETDIGPIPANWVIVPIGQATTRAQYGLSVRGQRSGMYPLLRMNCQDDGRTLFRDLQYVDLAAREFESFRLSDGDLLFNRTNSYELVGRTSLFEGERPAVFASYLIRLAIDRRQVVPAFLNYYLGMASTQLRLKSLASRGVSQANISASKLREFPIPLPTSLAEQEEIVSQLRVLDSALESSKGKESLLKELFVTLLDGFMSCELHAPAIPSPAEKEAVLAS